MNFLNVGHVWVQFADRICYEDPRWFTHTTIIMVLMVMGAHRFLKVTAPATLRWIQKRIKGKLGNILLSPARDGPGPDLCLSGKETDPLTEAKVNSCMASTFLSPAGWGGGTVFVGA